MKIVLILLVVLLAGCAHTQNVHTCLEGTQYGFWGGLWHGLTMPVSFIGQLFSDHIAVWAVNNNGGWYTFGFVFGAGGIGKILNFGFTTRKNG